MKEPSYLDRLYRSQVEAYHALGRTYCLVSKLEEMNAPEVMLDDLRPVLANRLKRAIKIERLIEDYNDKHRYPFSLEDFMRYVAQHPEALEGAPGEEERLDDEGGESA